MIYSVIDIVLILSLVSTSITVFVMYNRLKNFDALQNKAAEAFIISAKSLQEVKKSFDKFNKEGGELAVILASKLNDSRISANEIQNVSSSTDNKSAMIYESRFDVQDYMERSIADSIKQSIKLNLIK